MKSNFSILLAVFALIASTLACAVGGELSLTNARMSLDQDGKNVTTTFKPTDALYAVADLSNAPKGTKVDAKWIAVDVPGEQANSVFKETNYVTDTDGFSVQGSVAAHDDAVAVEEIERVLWFKAEPA